jgi:hypothetical protein
MSERLMPELGLANHYAREEGAQGKREPEGLRDARARQA